MDTSRFTRLAAACRPAFPIALIVFFCSPAARLFAAEPSLRGRILDQLGAPIHAATVILVRDGQHVSEAASDARGEFSFSALTDGRYQVDVIAAGFAPRTSDAVFVTSGGQATLDVGLRIGAIEQHVVVTAAANELPQAQVGADVTVLDAGLIDALGNTDLLEPLRTVPGVTVVQAGARGGATSLFVRGGASNFTKVLVDGVPANDIGGAFDFADLSTAGVERVEVLRGSNSVLYGTDALSGVINVTTKRGRTRIPEAMLSIDGGNFGTSRGDASVGGAVDRFDYFTGFSHLQTDNNVPNNSYRNNSSASRFGALLGRTDLSGTVRHSDTTYGSPNAFDYFGIADDASQARTATYASVAAQSQLSSRLTSTVRFSIADQTYHSTNPSPTGQRSDPSSFANYLGNVTTIAGANGYSVTGRAILDYSGTYPSTFDSSVTRRLLYGEVGARIASAFDLAGGVRLEDERGSSGATSKTARTNSGAFVEARVQALGLLYVNGGLGFDHNEIFGFAWTPRVSVAAYLHKPTAAAAIGDTKVTFNAGKGIKEPDLFQELSSLYALVPAATSGSLGIAPVGPERSRSVDVGVEQGLAGGHGRVRLAYFDNEFSDLIEYVSKGVLPQLGVSTVAANAAGFGAYVNSQSNSSSGIELSAEAKMGRVRILGAYTYVDAVVTKSFSSGVLSPAVNPAFPAVTIGQYSPLVGNRPFRRPANSGSLVAVYSGRKAQLSIAGYFVGKQDDSTFLSDQFFGYSLLLPNQDMDPAYQKIDVSGSYLIHPRLRWYVIVENAFNVTFEAAGGYPALGRSLRTGLTVRAGGR
jgi:iron complex outermembrane receptor protein/vitamin B12 transporter